MIRRHALSLFAAFPLALGGLGCPSNLPPAVILSDVVAGVEQANIILSQIESQLVQWPGADAQACAEGRVGRAL